MQRCKQDNDQGSSGEGKSAGRRALSARRWGRSWRVAGRQRCVGMLLHLPQSEGAERIERSSVNGESKRKSSSPPAESSGEHGNPVFSASLVSALMRRTNSVAIARISLPRFSCPVPHTCTLPDSPPRSDSIRPTPQAASSRARPPPAIPRPCSSPPAQESQIRPPGWAG